MAKLEPSQITSFQDGAICESQVSNSQRPLTTVSLAVNVNFDKIGAIQSRPGSTRLGNQITASNEISGLYEFIDKDGTNRYLLTSLGTSVYYLSGATWTNTRTIASGYKSRFSTFLNYVFMVNGIDSTAVWNGSGSWSTSGNAANAPIGKYIENFRTRMWIAGNSTFPDRLYYTDVPTAAASPVVVWDTNVATGNWIDISPSDGENITGLKRAKNILLVFKQNHIYQVASVNDTEPDPKIYVGTYSQESIVSDQDSIYFHHPTGIYKYQGGGVSLISKPVQDWIDGMSVSAYDDVCGWTDDDHVYHSIGDVTVDGNSYSNVVLRYTISSKVWTVYTYPTKPLFASNYNDGTTIYHVVGDDDGNVIKMNTGNDDLGTPIPITVVTRPYTFDGLFSTTKSISSIAAEFSKAEGMKLSYRVDDDNINKYTDCMVLKKAGEPTTVSIKGNKIWFRLSGYSKGEPFTFDGIEVLNIQNNK